MRKYICFGQFSTLEKTIVQYQQIRELCKQIFIKKNLDYGSSWRILRVSSLTDQLLIKAYRIRGIETNQVQKVDEQSDVEYIGIINYSIMALIQLDLGTEDQEVDYDRLSGLYADKFNLAFELMKNKNHDYGEIWRQMRMSSFTDLILSKILRIKRIESNDGQTIISEGIASNYFDIINYAVFALILWSEEKKWSFL